MLAKNLNLNPTLRKEHERIKQMIPHLKNNLSSWDHGLEYKLMCGKTIASKLSRLLSSAAQMSDPRAAKVNVQNFLQSSGDLFEFYERAEPGS